MLRCSKCVLPETYSNIRFNKEGVCNYCLSHKPIRYKGERALREILDSYRNKGKKYDCIVGVSGGRDSSFVLHSLVKKYGMRVLAYNYESGFTSEQAKRNLRAMIDKLNVDLVQIRSQIQEKLLKRHIIAWARNPKSEPFPQLCYGCSMGSHGGAYKIARKMKIPLLITGRSQTEFSIFKEVLFSHLPTRLLSYEKKLTPLKMFLKAVKNPFYLAPQGLSYYVFANIEFATKGWRVGGDETIRGLESDRYVRVLRFFDYIKHNKEDTSVIAEKLGWKKSSSLSSSWRFDCQIHSIYTYMFRRELGFSENDEMLSIMIREKLISRDEALRKIKHEERDVNALITVAQKVFEKINLPKKYRDRIIYC